MWANRLTSRYATDSQYRLAVPAAGGPRAADLVAGGAAYAQVCAAYLLPSAGSVATASCLLRARLGATGSPHRYNRIGRACCGDNRVAEGQIDYGQSDLGTHVPAEQFEL